MARLWMAVAFCLAAVPALAGELTFWTWRQEDRGAYTELFRMFTEAHPGITVKFEAFPNEQYQTILSTALAGGKGPDVIHTKAYGGLEQLARAGYLRKLDGVVPELAAFPPAALASTTLRADKAVYSVPFASQTLGLFINKDVFAKAGVTAPTTWAELLSACQALKAKGVIPIANGTQSPFMTEVLTSVVTNPFLGLDFVADVLAGRTTFEDKRYVAALGHLLELREFMPPGFTAVDYPTMQQLFTSGRAAMFFGGSFEIATFRRQNPKIDMDFVAPPSPTAGAARPVSVFYDGGYAINAKSAHEDDAATLLRFMASKPFGDKFTALLGNLSPIPGVVVKDDLLAKVAALDTVSMPYLMLVYFRFDSPTGSELLQNAVQKMMAGTLTPAQVGAEVTAGIAKNFKPFQGK